MRLSRQIRGASNHRAPTPDRCGRFLRRVAGLSICLAVLLASVGAMSIGADLTSFVTRSGSQLILDGQAFRFSGPNIYWLGLDENGRTALSYPTHARINDALLTAADMGATVARVHTLGVSTGNPLSFEPRLGTFSDRALEAADYALKIADDKGVRLIIPLTDNYGYYHGGFRNFTDWLGLSPSDFYTNSSAISAFENYVSHLLDHVNQYTGIAYKNDPTILAWETGNELAPPSSWTATISTYIKSVDPNHLVLDGSYGIEPTDLGLPNVDIYSDHFYPMNASRLASDAAAVYGAGKAFIAGEYAWNTSGLPSFLDAIEAGHVSGDLYWSLFPHNDSFGFVQHFDGYQLHFPGDTGKLATYIGQLRSHAYAMRDVVTPPPFPTPAAPLITNIERLKSSILVEWRGSAGASTYIVQRRAASASGSWKTVCTTCTDKSTPWADTTAPKGSSPWYRVAAVNPDGVAGPSSNAYRAQWQTLDYPLDIWCSTYRHSADLRLDTAHSSFFGGDGSRARSASGATSSYAVWYATKIKSFELLGYYSPGSTPSTACVQGAPDCGIEGSGAPTHRHFDFFVSANGTGWKAIPPASVIVNGGVVSPPKWTKYTYTILGVQKILKNASYVKVQWHSGSPSAEIGEARVSY